MAVAALTLAVSFPGAAGAADGWTFQPVPLPSGSSFGSLTAISCVSADSCLAVGSALAEYWNGSTWTPTASLADAAGIVLNAVSCGAADSCTAVGVGRLTDLPVAEYWNGSTWTMQTVPRDRASDELYAVSCASATKCTADGKVGIRPHQHYRPPLTERWNGSRWQVRIPPLPAGEPDGTLTGVSCVAATYCTAVGRAYGRQVGKEHAIQPLIEQWNGTQWSATVPPSLGTRANILTAITCVSRSYCVAVGYADGGKSLLAERWNGSAWSVQPVPGWGPRITSLLGVSCVSPADCTAVGVRTRAGNTVVALAVHWNGTKWAVQPTAHSANQVLLEGVSCVAGGFCEAVGQRSSPSGSHPVAESKNG